ncbi:sugar phosphate isomerase/epimerase [Paenibacillus sp. IB182496]|uniref:Sugar phosphate isomerase/epimerase n=1 Tax=Paenibacillus sabuli TaxID=2772509 RepID=A0A927BUF4_9BACL|nr:sugar phosphate isomerase/epimerase [Paenibacillus sabuli]
MKLSFSTLGCPDWPIDQIIERAAAYGYDGIDMRGCQGVMAVYTLPAFGPERASTKRRLEEAGLVVSCFSSSVTLVADGDKRAANVREITAYAQLCEFFGTPYIRVFGGAIGAAERADACAAAAEHLRELSALARPYGVTLLLETHDDWTRHEDVEPLMALADAGDTAVLWDVHHPYRMHGEQPEDTLAALAPRIAYTHWKDSVPAPDTKHGHHYCLLGEGDVPLRRMFELLRETGYDGWYTLEWEKKWHPEIAEPETALPQYVQYMRALESGQSG